MVIRSPRLETPSAPDAWPAVVPGDVDLQGLFMTHSDGRRAHVGVRPAMVLCQAGVIREAVLAGAGYTLLPLPMVARDIASGCLIRLLPEWNSLSRPVLPVYLSLRQLAPKVRTLIDLLTQRLPLMEGFEAVAR